MWLHVSLFGRLGLNGTIPSHLLRLYIHLILSCSMGNFAVVMATVCSSWVQINCFTSCRSLLLPEGDGSKRYIQEANTMLSRTLIFTLVTVSWQHFWVQDNVSWVHVYSAHALVSEASSNWKGPQSSLNSGVFFCWPWSWPVTGHICWSSHVQASWGSFSGCNGSPGL